MADMRYAFSWIFAVLLLGGCSPSDIHETRFIMGTLVEFTVADADSARAEAAMAAAADEMQRIENIFTIYGKTDNAVKAFNASPPGVPVELPGEVNALLGQALDIEKRSDGAFNPALGRLNRLWGFSGESPPSQPPSSEAIRDAMPVQPCIHRLPDGRWQRNHASCMLDFGAIAKGYAIDRGMAVLKQRGIHHAIINAGGDIRLIGSHHGKPWRIGLRHPRRKGAVLGSLSVSGDVSIVTSGDYERYFLYKDRRYHHILNPQTGMPATASQSATVIAASATLADAWSTALFVLGPDGLAHLERLGMPALLVDRKGRLKINDSMRLLFDQDR